MYETEIQELKTQVRLHMHTEDMIDFFKIKTNENKFQLT